MIFAEYKGAFYSSEAQFAETGSNVKVQESIGVKSTVLEGRHVVPTKFVLRLKQVEEEVTSHRRYK